MTKDQAHFEFWLFIRQISIDWHVWYIVFSKENLNLVLG